MTVNLKAHWKIVVIILICLMSWGFLSTLRWKPYPQEILNTVLECNFMELKDYKAGFREWLNFKYPSYPVTSDMNAFQLLMWERTFLKYISPNVFDPDFNESDRGSDAWNILLRNRYWIMNQTKYDPTIDPKTGFYAEVPNENFYTKGRCGEFSMLFYGLLVLNGIQARVIVDASTQHDWNKTGGSGDHVWIEINWGSGWIHVDPTEDIWNDPKMYSRSPTDIPAGKEAWNKDVNDVYAITGESIVDVTTKYQ